MAAGVNYNGVWAGLGIPISPFDVHKAPYHIAGSDASGIVWAVGVEGDGAGRSATRSSSTATRTTATTSTATAATRCTRPSQRIWGYETPNGSFAQFTNVQSQQLMARPQHLTWEQSACYTLTLATAYRMLFGHAPHELRPGQNVLVWGASGGLGSFAIQLINTAGANAIGVISEENKRDFVLSLGAKGVINRKDFNCWGQMPTVNSPEYKAWLGEARKFGKAIWEITGKGVNVDMVFEHPGEATFPVSVLVVKKGGMVVICAGTSGYNLTLDARYLWMNQKRVQGSHFANLKQASAANQLMLERRLDPCMSEVFPWAQIPRRARQDAAERAQARQHGGAGQRPDDRPPDLRRHRRGEPRPRLIPARIRRRRARRFAPPVESIRTISILWLQRSPHFGGINSGEFTRAARRGNRCDRNSAPSQVTADESLLGD